MPRSALVRLCLLGVVAPAAAQSGLWTESDTLALLTEPHPALQRLLEERDLAAAERRRAGLLPNPELSLVSEAPGEARETTAGFEWALPGDGRRGIALAAADAGLAASEFRAAAARLALRAELRSAHAEWALAGARLRLLDQHVERQLSLLAKERARFAAGEIAGTALRRLELEAALLGSSRAGAQSALIAARVRLESLGPSPPPEAVPVLPSPPIPPTGPPPAETHPEIAALEREVARAEAQTRLAAKVLSAPRLGAGWKRIKDGSLEADGLVLSLGWELPLFDRRQAESLEAEAKSHAAAASLALARRRLEVESRAALELYCRAREQVITLSQLRESLSPLLAGAEAAYAAGELSLTDLLDVLRETQSVRESELESLASALAAHRRLELAFGTPLPLAPGDSP